MGGYWLVGWLVGWLVVGGWLVGGWLVGGWLLVFVLVFWCVRLLVHVSVLFFPLLSLSLFVSVVQQ